MKEENGTREQLLKRLEEQRHRIAELEALETERKRVERELISHQEQLQKKIAERELIEKALREETRLNRILIDQMPCVTMLLSPGTRTIVASNTAAAGVDAVPGKQCFKTWGQRDEPCPWCLAPIAWSTGESQQVEFENMGIVWDAHWIPVKDNLYLHYAFDVTQKRRMEDELLKMDKLESVGVLAGGIAHDFNNILTGILGNISLADMYLQSGRVDRIPERLAEAEKASMRAKDLTQQLLTFSEGGAPIKKEMSVAELLRNSAILASRNSNVRCEFSIPDGLWQVEIDEGQMNQVISNIITNAVEAMADGGTIEIHAENLTVETEEALPLKPGKYIGISVKDHGLGIPTENLSRVFDPYFTTKQAGRGLGLAASHSIVKKHDGYITVESQLGAGATFNIYLPIFSEASAPSVAEANGKPIMGAGRILVMDDEGIVRELASDILVGIGYTVSTAKDGAEAIRLYKAAMESGNPFIAVVLDLTVPGGIGGAETVQKLKEIDPEVKAIVSSGYSDSPIMSGFKEYGFSDMIIKPYRARGLSEVLHRVIAREDD